MAEPEPASPFLDTPEKLWARVEGEIRSAFYNLEHAHVAARYADLDGYLYAFRLALDDVKRVASLSRQLPGFKEGGE